MSNISEITASQLTELLPITLAAGLVPYIKGAPGIGKSAITGNIQKRFNLELIDCRLAGYEPTDLNGFPTPDKEKGKAVFLPTEDFPLEGEKLPEGKKGWLLFLDELSSAPPAVQAAAYKLILDRKVGQRKLNSKVFIIAAGNRDEDRAITTRMSTALQSRVVHYTMKSDTKNWINWANKNNIHHTVVSYVTWKKESNNFKPEKANEVDTYMCERTLEFLSKQMHEITKDGKQVEQHHLPLIMGTIGEAEGISFHTYSQIYNELPTIKEIEDNPYTCLVPDSPDRSFAISGAIGNHLNENNADALCSYISRMEPEFQFTGLRYALAKNSALLSNKHIQEWTVKHAKKLQELEEM